MSKYDNENTNDMFQIGGSLATGFPTYVVRPADEEIYRNLRNGNFCYVLTARQMGKSSLRVRTMDRLQKDGYACTSIDITSIGSQTANVRQWYYSFLYQICRGFNIPVSVLKNWWKEKIKLTSVVRLVEFFQEIILTEVKENIVIFVDEIDSLLSLDRQEFSTDDFFAAIRAFINSRADNPDFQRLNFVIIGVAAPNDLMNDPVRTPFNIGISIQLRNFTYSEAQPMLRGFDHIKKINKRELLKEIIKWTGGQPYLTQKLSKSIAERDKEIKTLDYLVRSHVQKLFLSPKAEETDHNLANVSNRIINNKEYNAKMLGLYEQIVSGKRIKVNNSDNVHVYLQLSGIVHEEDGYLVISNKIYEKVFDKQWIIQALEKINRPFSRELNLWLKSNKSDAKAKLKGDILEEIYDWSRGRDDLSSLEREFIDTVRAVERKHKERQNRKLVIALIVSIFFIIIAAIFWYYANKQTEIAQEQKRIAENLRRMAEDVRDSIIIKEIRTQRALKIAQQERDTAEIKRMEATAAQYEANKQRKNLNRIKEALRLISLAQQEAEINPTDALRLAMNAWQLDKNNIVTEALYKIYRENTFYKIIAERKEAFNCVAFSPDRQLFLVGLSDKTAQLINTTGKTIKTLKGHDGVIINVAFAPDGKTMLTGSYNNTAYLWNTSGELINSFKWHNAMVTSVTFSPDGKYILTGTYDSNAYLWDLEGNEVMVFRGHNDYIQTVAFSNDSKYVLTGSWDKTARLWNIKGEQLCVFAGHDNFIHAVAFSPNGRYIVTASSDKNMRLWDRDENLLQIFQGQKSTIQTVKFSPNGKYILSGTHANNVYLWDLEGHNIQMFKGHTNSIENVAFAPSGEYILTGSSDRTIRRWQLNNVAVRLFEGHTGAVIAADVAQNKQYVLTGARDNKAILWHWSGKQKTVLDAHQQWVNAVAISPDNQKLLTGSTDRTAILWDSDGTIVKKLTGHQAKITHVDFSSDQKHILTASDDGNIKLWNIQGKLLRTIEAHQNHINDARFAPEGNKILSASNDKTAKVWTLQGNLITTLKHTDKVQAIRSMNKKNYVTAVSANKTVYFWNDNGSLSHTVILRGASVESVYLSNNVDYILTRAWDNSTALYNNQGHCIQKSRSRKNDIYSVTFSNHNEYLFFGGADKKLEVQHVKFLLRDFFEQ